MVHVLRIAGEGEGQGWTFAPAAIEPMVAAVSSAVNLFREEPDKWQALQLRGMARDSSWERAAQQYEQVRPGGMQGRWARGLLQLMAWGHTLFELAPALW